MTEKVKDEEIFLDAFTREAVLLTAERFRKHEAALTNIKEEISMLEKRINSFATSSSSKSHSVDTLLIERLKNLEEKVNRLEGIVNALKMPKVDKNILERLK